MINGIKLKDSNLSPNQRRIRLMELSGIPISEKQKKRLFNESVSMVEIPKNRTQLVPKKPIQEPNEENDIDLEEVLREMGFYEEDEETSDEIDNEEIFEEDLENLIDDIEDEIFLDEIMNEIHLEELGVLKLSEETIKIDGVELKGGYLGGDNNTLVYKPSSSKMIDKIEDMGISKESIVKKLISFLQRKHRGLKFLQDYSYEGYGYPIKLDMWSFK